MNEDNCTCIYGNGIELVTTNIDECMVHGTIIRDTTHPLFDSPSNQARIQAENAKMNDNEKFAPVITPRQFQAPTRFPDQGDDDMLDDEMPQFSLNSDMVSRGKSIILWVGIVSILFFILNDLATALFIKMIGG